MMYLHDVWVNWFEGEENGYNICPYYEWKKTDTIELLDQIPVLFIETRLYKYIENHLSDLPKKLLDNIHEQTFIKKGDERIPLTYATVVTDGEEVLAFDTIGYSVPIRKSRLIPRQERKVLQIIKHEQRAFFPLKEKEEKKEYHLLSLSPDAMVGLTRRERQLKQLLMMTLDALRETKNRTETQYWLTEWLPDQYERNRELSFTTAWEKLYQGVYNGWSEKHEAFCLAMIKGQPFFEQLWELANQETSTTLVKRTL
ncbi:hypothetical protein J2T56_002156 [Natronobacillus azotifigens]|uniref:DUF3603 family protein n=1 Tax=Natronobacillus azotifigens TaxID=472978 RepID=A0A9J6RF05_9BACI|nr:DUF3603 family protein [Natronobacillus azotifigens]MCZ0703923.1 DUF3603 family protein [Natronobacillus azotifigens]